MKITPILLVAALLLACPFSPAFAGELKDARCYACHKKARETFSQGNTHNPVAEGDCLECHQRHSGDWKPQLVEKVPALCLRCHEKPAGNSLHRPVGEGQCLDCHNPHHSTEPKLLTSAPSELCGDCHNDHVKIGFGHATQCIGCHEGHTSQRVALLRGGYPIERRTSFSEEAYALCFRCHDGAAFREPVTRTATLFRDGEQNLHYLHTVGKGSENRYALKERSRKGLSCGACHAVHGSAQPKALRTSFKENGRVIYPLTFTAEAAGGTCVVGCHKPQTYDRNPPPQSSARAPDSSAGEAARRQKAVN